jgi:hypothetical protein
MIETTEMLSQKAQLLAGRESELAEMNAVRLLNWQRRIWYTLVPVPEPRDPPNWPAVTVAKPKEACTVTPIRKARK